MQQQSKNEPALYARLKPFDPKRDHAMRVFVVGMRRFDAGAWVPVSEAMAMQLRSVRQSHYDELSPLAFEVLSATQAKEQGIAPSEESVIQASVATEGHVSESGSSAPDGGPGAEAAARSPGRIKKGRES